MPGNVWHLAGRTALTSGAGGDPFAALTASVYEQVLTVAGAFIVAGLLLSLSGGGPAYLWAALAIPAGLLVLHPALQRWVTHRAARLLGREPPKTLGVGRLAGLLAVYTLPNLPAGCALVALGWPAGPDVVSATGAFGFAWAVGFLSFLTPSGIGVREVVLAATLGAGGLGGADPVALAIGHRVVLTAAELLIAAMSVIVGRLSARVL
jgi:uncharacterized membrane protein YbhN (UPF0104 family)